MTDCCLDCHDPNFLKRPNKDDEGPATKEDENEETDIEVLLKFVENINDDFKSYLNDEIPKYKLINPATVD